MLSPAPSATGPGRDHPVLGIATFTGNLLVMAMLSAAVRELVERDYPLAQVLLFRYLFASLCFWAVLFSTALPSSTTWEPMSLVGFNNMGFMSTWGGIRAASA